MTELTPAQNQALRAARALLDLGYPSDEVLNNPIIPASLRSFVREHIERDNNFQLSPARMLVADPNRPDWLADVDRSNWYYWPTLRQHLLAIKGWNGAGLRSLEDNSDRILRQLANPGSPFFDIRGLVLGFVQSGKTTNYTALIAKAADAGYRLIVVLAGIDNGLRLQTNVRLKRELVGYVDNRPGTVALPPIGKQWHEFTRDDIHGDFHPGFANHAALQGSQPVLLVVKKNGAVLRRLLRWLDDSPQDVRQALPFLLIDDEADQASVDTRGTYQTGDEDSDPDYEPPSVINGLIRDLLRRFERRAYVAYTATPFANILIPHDTVDPAVGNDLYPKDFIVDLPKPPDYFGAEEFFGRMDPQSGEIVTGLDVVREVPDEDIVVLEGGQLPGSLELAILDFVLAGGARAKRTTSDFPATMLVHTSQYIVVQGQLRRLVEERFADLRDAWRYHRGHGIRARLKERWEAALRPNVRARDLSRDLDFEAIESHLGPFLESVQVREINSATGAILDYQREPNLKAIAVGGNRLSRGLTLEGLMTSYFVRRSATYDTLMQMGRWFGFRAGYEDLTRIYTTAELAGWFADLAFVEHRLREDLLVYESQDLTPFQVGMRIWQHPTMQVTSPLKRRSATTTIISSSYAMALEQTWRFPLRRTEDLAVLSESNLQAVRSVVSQLGSHNPTLSDGSGPVWANVSPEIVLQFLRSYRVDDQVRSISLSLICAYIERLLDADELTRWTIGVRGRAKIDKKLGDADWGLPTGRVHQISRSRLMRTDSLGVIVDPEDEAIGLETAERGRNARVLRSPKEGLLLLYPISRWSGHDLAKGAGNRKPLLDDPDGPLSRDFIGLAISFPRSSQTQAVEAYMQGTVGWRPVA